MPLLRKASDGAAAGSACSPTKLGATAGARPPSKGGGSGAGAGAGGARKASTPVPPLAAAQQQQQKQQQQYAGSDDYAVPVREVVQPPNQLALTEAELDEEVGRSLTVGNPVAPANLVRYSFKDGGYRAEPIIDQQLHHFSLSGSLMHRESDEAARERRRRESVALMAHSRRVTAQAQSRRATMATGEGGSGAVLLNEASGSGGTAVLRGETSAMIRASMAGAAAGPDGDATRLRNQFNFADRAAQTGHQAPRERGTMTEPPPTATASGSCSRSEIFEAYVQDQDRQRQTEELAKQKAQVSLLERRGRGAQQAAAQAAIGAALAPIEAEEGNASNLAALSTKSAKLMERMVNQNLFKDLVMDFKYWDDPADAIKTDEGTLLPLWSFGNARAKQRAVTALCWNPRYFDLFAVGYGSFDFMQPTTGLVACYSLKNPGHPEYSFATGAGVMCLDFHPGHPNLLAVGCYDGHICIFDVRAEGGQPLYKSSARSGKHADPVWQVCWQRTDSHELQLCSISTDGRVTLWSVSKNELSHQDLLELHSLRGRDDLLQPTPRQAGEEYNSGTLLGSQGGAPTGGIAGGCCFDFNREQDYLFIVGSEDGSLYKCSTAYASEYLQAFQPGHRMPVYAVRWNGLHSRTFLSAGADWKVKLWDSVQPKPVLSFDLGAAVGDVAWAPFSSTVFAASTDAGRVHVFDLAQSRAAAICTQRVAKKSRLTKLAFNVRHPVLLVGTEHGGVACLKLSPNLRRSFNQGAVELHDNRLARTDSQCNAVRTAEAARLEAVLELAGKCNQAIQPADWELM